MDVLNQPRLPERNPLTHATHRREVFWQIILPLIIGLLLILAALGAIIFSAIQPVTGVERWADVSLMWLILPSLFFALIFLVVLVGFTYAISLLLKFVPRYAYVVQQFFGMVKFKVSQITNLSTGPFIRLNSTWAMLRHLLRLGRNQPQG